MFIDYRLPIVTEAHLHQYYFDGGMEMMAYIAVLPLTSAFLFKRTGQSSFRHHPGSGSCVLSCAFMHQTAHTWGEQLFYMCPVHTTCVVVCRKMQINRYGVNKPLFLMEGDYTAIFTNQTAGIINKNGLV